MMGNGYDDNINYLMYNAALKIINDKLLKY